MMYENYSFMFILIIVGALGHVPKCTFTNIQNLGFTKNETKKLVKKLHVLSVTGTVKISKTFIISHNILRSLIHNNSHKL